ncbi:hypothetical protein Bcav_4096 [Beutenbergia cavernae DSM 12333]|uniref:Polymerase nucleotidyl transferase domain-containing protein n=1 Tax=Beutenbergia cavernae (strain ATCC BAA-8 / DSM 12333 / CCUG 43141 / JCM 11478 / NBRC 16432 / NCIMB 13614 / HKI 0122) TaxID=471853 RepID=C5C5X9_BEUC1|nr:hypothetical protein [Beutenbergia cavernae]ACQ82337.1 hypothetical protein Bcav_4096 [Beutenbergia cavernae DSM 12333]
MTTTSSGPQGLVDALTAWAERTPWVDWLELSGSLGRGAGDALSDVDAGLGVADGESLDVRRDEALAAARAFAPVAGSLAQPWASGSHLVILYDDGRQLSLVVVPAEFRTGLPPEARALVDRAGRLATPLGPDRWVPDGGTRHEWAFLAWVAVGDAARHAHRGHPWRALRCLTEGRDLVWQLWAADLGLTYPHFGAVTVENAGAPVPPGLERTHPRSLEAADLLDAAAALAGVLRAIDAPVDDGVPGVIEERVRLLGT